MSDCPPNRLGPLADRRGVTALEYSLLAALIAGAIALPVGRLGAELSTLASQFASFLASHQH